MGSYRVQAGRVNAPQVDGSVYTSRVVTVTAGGGHLSCLRHDRFT